MLSPVNTKVVTLLTSDRLTSRMFVDYYTAIHAGGKRPLTISPSFFNSADMVCGQISMAKEQLKGESDLLVLYSVPDAFDPINMPPAVADYSDVVLLSNPKRAGNKVLVLKSGGQGEGDAIAERFSMNLQRMSAQ